MLERRLGRERRRSGGGFCVTTETDEANCGACGKTCAAGEVCSAGTCALSCAAPLTTCTTGGEPGDAGDDATDAPAGDSYCANTQTDRLNCGACGKTCAAGEICVDGACVLSCGGGTTDCSGSCKDLSVDTANCGVCGKACAAGEVCTAGGCATSCGGGTTLCDASCKDLASDPGNCGTCGKTCAAGEVCTAGECKTTCASGTTLCGASCKDTQNDPANCGTCGKICAAGESCVTGACKTVCAGGSTLCGSSCVDTDNDPTNCGTCGKTCAAGQVCSAGACTGTCTGGATACGASCTVTLWDRSNCGACGNACATGEACAAGACKPLAVLVYHDASSTLADEAVTALGGTVISSNEADFVTKFDAGDYQVIVIDSASNALPSGADSRIAAWASSGGRLLFSYWDLDATPASLRSALEVSTVSFHSLRTLHDDPTSAVSMFTYARSLPSPLTGSEMGWDDDGDELTLTGSGFIAARFGSASGPGAIAVTRANRVVVNGFLPNQMNDTDADADGKKDMQELYENELLYVLAH